MTTNSAPRTAILVTGLPRFGQNTDSLINTWARGGQIDWYIALWRTLGPQTTQIDPRWLTLSQRQISREFTQRFPDSRHQVKLCQWLDPDALEPPPRDYPGFYCDSASVWQQYKLLQYANLQRRLCEYSDLQSYDIVIRARLDAAPSHVQDLTVIQDIVTRLPQTLITANGNRQPPYDLNDQLVIGASAAMNLFCDAVDHFDRAYNSGTEYNPERLLGRILTEQGLNWPTTDWTSTLKTLGEYTEQGQFIQQPGSWKFIDESNQREAHSAENFS